MLPVVAIIGRPNVGKSTLFNRLVESRQAIVDNQPGVTRDRHFGQCHWTGKDFLVIDTGGLVPDSEDLFEKAIREQVDIAFDQADVVLMVVDARAGLHPHDQIIANEIRRLKQKHFLLAVNKVEGDEQQMQAAEFYQLGLDPMFQISAASGSGTGELLDAAVALFGEQTEDVASLDLPKIAIVGRPNVGKSSFVNALLGKNERIVTDVPGTTRDSMHTRYQAFGYDYILIDTAGLRRKARVEENVEYYSNLRTIKAIEEADVCVLMLDATVGIHAQDLKILSLIESSKKGLVILLNKWDLVENKDATKQKLADEVAERILPLAGVPIITISAVEKVRLLKALEACQSVVTQMKKMIPTHHLNDVILPLIQNTPPPTSHGKTLRIKFVTQVPSRIPTFLFFTNYPKYVKESYKRYLENQLRKHFGFEGVPLNIFFREK